MDNIPEEIDILIVGGGPAGVSAAITAASLGAKTMIFDRKPYSEIGNKVCGDAIGDHSIQFLSEHLNIPPPSGDSLSDPINTVTAALDINKQHLNISAKGCVVDRLAYGQYLLEIAVEKGTLVVPEARILRPIIENDHCVGAEWKCNGTSGKTRAKVVIDASGTIATIRTKLPEEFAPSLSKTQEAKHMAITYREILEFKNKEHDHNWRHDLLLYFPQNLPIDGYFWIFSKGEYKINAGIGWAKQDVLHHTGNALSLKDEYQTLIEKFCENMPYDTLAKGGGRVPVRPPLDNAVGSGFIAAGDAACHADPMTAEGHGPALMAGYFAAKHSVDAIKRNDCSLESLWGYNKDVMNEFGAKHGILYVIVQMIKEMGYSNFSKLITKKIITGSDLEQLTDDIESNLSAGYMLKKAIRAFPNFGLLLDVRRASKLAEKVKKHYHSYPQHSQGLDKWIEERNALLPHLL